MGVIDQPVIVWVLKSDRGVLMGLPDVVNGKAAVTTAGRRVNRGVCLTHVSIYIGPTGVEYIMCRVNDRDTCFDVVGGAEVEFQLPLDIRPRRRDWVGLVDERLVPFSRIADLVAELYAEWAAEHCPADDVEADACES